jgi:AcrR family transcriptional regulator
MSLYRHVNGKDELLVSMMDSVLGEDPLPARSPTGWRPQLELSSRMQWQGFRRHPWLAPALSITRPQLIPNGMRHTEWALRALDGLGLTIQEMMHVHITLFSHVRGLALNLEAEAQAEQDSGLTSDEWMQTQEHGFRVIAGTGDFPLLNRLVDSEMELDLDQLFEFGLGRLLDGLERHLAGR